jgi:hypothetical protein
MKFKKTMLAVAAVGAVTASAVPAMALENEFHGMYRLRGFVSNFDDSNSGAVAIGAQPGSKNFGKDAPTYTYVEQRARLMYIAKANDNLRLVTHFELDSRFGDTSYNANAVNPALTGTTTAVSSATRNGGGGVGADQTNLETKNVFLEFKIPSTPVTVKAGIQGFTDNYKGIIFNNDAAGVTAVAKMGPGTIQGAWFRFDDATTGNTYLGVTNATPATTVTNATVGFNTRDFATVGGKFNVSNAVTVGADYYLLYSDVLRHTQDKTYVNMVGANAEAKIGPATVNGFAIYQFGKLPIPFAAGSAVHTHQNISAFAGNLAAKMAVGPGTARLTALLVTGDHNTGGTGDRNDFQTIMERGATTSGHTFYESNSMLLLRNVQASDKTDRAVVFDLNNNGRGTIAGFAGYDLLLGKFFMNSNIGVGAVQKDNRNAQTGGSTYGSGSSNILGTELNTDIGYKLYDNMTASVQAAYLVLGDYYSRVGGKPENPYTTRVVLNYAF